MANISATCLCLTILLSAYLTYFCVTPPNPKPSNPHAGDRISRVFGSNPLALRRLNVLCLCIYHAFLALTFPSTSSYASMTLCPNPSHLNPVLFTWTNYPSICLALIIFLGAPLRLAAYTGLGRNFTFQLAEPDKLITTGLYKYMQHPSYLGQFIVLGANLALFARWDGGLGCWISDHRMERIEGWGRVIYSILGVLAVVALALRVRDEEKMLKEKFGKEWENWHLRTARFIPWIV
jgi:protein-S-isoprenylcysteine O-methyltransferase Ste14